MSEIVVAVIPAKQFSARLPGKNMADICGKPLIEWSFIQAAACKEITHTVFVTDDGEMADLARRYTPLIAMQDPARTLPAVANGWTATIEGLDLIKREVGEPDVLISMLPTSPLKKPCDLKNIIWAFRKWRASRGVKLVLPSVRFHEITLAMDLGNGQMCRVLANWTGNRRWMNSTLGWCACSVAAYRSTMDTTLLDDPQIFMEVERWQGFDVDTEIDLELVRAMFRKYIIEAGGY